MFKMEIDTDGAAFRDESWTDENGNTVLDPSTTEIRRILVSVVDELIEGYTSGTVMDVNGNKVGKWSLEG